VNKTNQFTIASLFILVTAFMSIPITLAQTEWDYCKISAYGTGLDDYSTSTSNQDRLAFTVVEPPSGSNITNTVEVKDNASGENYTINLAVGERVYIDYQYRIVTENYQTPTSDPDILVIFYEGEVAQVTINNIDVPEFPIILIVPLFMAATLMAIVYRRKNISQTKTTH
jgi:hypothetical protein